MVIYSDADLLKSRRDIVQTLASRSRLSTQSFTKSPYKCSSPVNTQPSTPTPSPNSSKCRLPPFQKPTTYSRKPNVIRSVSKLKTLRIYVATSSPPHKEPLRAAEQALSLPNHYISYAPSLKRTTLYFPASRSKTHPTRSPIIVSAYSLPFSTHPSSKPHTAGIERPDSKLLYSPSRYSQYNTSPPPVAISASPSISSQKTKPPTRSPITKSLPHHHSANLIPHLDSYSRQSHQPYPISDSKILVRVLVLQYLKTK